MDRAVAPRAGTAYVAATITSSTTSGRTSSRRPTTARRGRGSCTGSPRTTSCAWSRGPVPPRPALRRHGARAVGLVRRRRPLAVVPAESAAGAGHDLVVKDNDLVVATHGRAFWIPRRPHAAPRVQGVAPLGAVHLLPPRPTVRHEGAVGPRNDEGGGGEATVGKNPPNGVLVTYFLSESPRRRRILTVEILDGDTVLRSYTTEKKDRDKDRGHASGARSAASTSMRQPRRQTARSQGGLEPARLGHAHRPAHARSEGGRLGKHQGPRVAPGQYAVRLKYSSGDSDAAFRSPPASGHDSRPRRICASSSTCSVRRRRG